MARKFTAELIGTFILVFFGCGAAVLAGFDVVGQLGIALAFGLAIVAIAYGVGPVSGGHVNPAVSLAVFMTGRMSAREMGLYWLAQIIGAVLGAAVLGLIAQTGFESLGQNGYGAESPGGYSLMAGALFEVVATAIFVIVILGVTGWGGQGPFAGLAIGLTLFLLHLPFIMITGLSVNPARSLGPALFVGGTALAQVWLFIVMPLVGGALAGILFKTKVLSAS